MSILWEWLDKVSLWWYAITAAFLLVILWLAYEMKHASVVEEEERQPSSRNPAAKQPPD